MSNEVTAISPEEMKVLLGRIQELRTKRSVLESRIKTEEAAIASLTRELVRDYGENYLEEYHRAMAEIEEWNELHSVGVEE